MLKFPQLSPFFTISVKKLEPFHPFPLSLQVLLSRKLAAGAEGVVVDVKWGKGSFITMQKMQQLARSSPVGRALKRRCVALVTDNNQPLGSMRWPIPRVERSYSIT